MKFSRDSWHHKFNSKISSGYDTQNISGLCPYFWFTVWNMIKAIGMVITLVMLTAIVGFALLALGVFLLACFTHTFVLGDLWIAGLGVFIGVSVGALGAAVDSDLKTFPEYMTKPFNKLVSAKDKTIETKSPSLVREYYKAFKSKVCPKIEWE